MILPKTLFTKLTLTLLFLFLLLGLLTVSVTFLATQYYQQEVMQRMNREVAKHIVDETELLKNGKLNQPALKALFHELMIFNPNLEIYLLDNNGTILAFSAPPWKVVRLSVDISPIKKYLTGESSFPIRGENPRSLTGHKVFSVAPIQYQDTFNGYLYIILGGDEYDSTVTRIQGSYILKTTLLVLIVGISMIILMGILMFSGLTRRLKKLAKSIYGFEQETAIDLTKFPDFKNDGDEVDQLAAAFHGMAEKVNQQLGDLQTTDSLRRELVANVSHDLRTPLATLQGYIETLLIKNADLTKDDRISYLKIAIKHCGRLNKLVAELFELAKLDASETKPQLELFNLAELIQDISIKYSLLAQQKSVTLSTHINAEEPFVYADISLIERALENLLDNAIRFVPTQGKISITVQPVGSKIELMISDNGSGIPKSEIPFIFDRFYQLEKNRSAENSNSGLGLTIVKRILDMHDSIIRVNSLPNHHTTFSFALLGEEPVN